MRVKKSALLNRLPPEWPHDLLPTIQAQVRAAGTKIVILDDDPTGGQTIHDVTVLTTGSVSALTRAFAEEEAVVDVLTNTRSMPLDKACAITRQVVTNCKVASQATGRDFAIINRSDSTLRGHYPGEVDALIAALEQHSAALEQRSPALEQHSPALDRPIDGVIFVPFFYEGGRITVNDTHYVTDGDELIPVGETEYARDAAFPYRNSNLRAWISEKHAGRDAAPIAPGDVVSISPWDVRIGGPDAVAAKLRTLANRQVCITNAVTYRDLEVFVAGLLLAEQPTPEVRGKRFVYRTAASFVRVRGGIAPRPLLTSAELAAAPPTGKGGLIIAGSHVNKTTQQVRAALALPDLHSVEIAVRALLDAAKRDHEIARVTTIIDAHLAAGQDVLAYTSRTAVIGDGGDAALQIGQDVSSALIRIVRGLNAIPAWCIAKGGITSSDIATRGLDVRRARVLGQAIPGVPIWRTGDGSRWPNMVYVVFPGNVGEVDALAEMIRLLRAT